MFKTLLSATALALISNMAAAGTYLVTVTNTMQNELLAPVLVTDAANDRFIFIRGGSYVTPEAEEQILTGDPAALAARIGAHAMAGHGANVAHGTDGPPGVLLAPGKSLRFVINTEADKLRVLAMVAPTRVPDNFVTALVDLGDMMMEDTMMDDGMASDDMADDGMADDGMADDSMMNGDMGMPVALQRFDIGNDEGTNTITGIAGNYATVTIVRQN